MKRILLILTTAMLCTFGLYAQTKITGTVVDKDNQPLMGVQVMPEAGGDAVTTDFDGKFEITVPEGTKLTFSMLGAKAKTEVAADGMLIVLSSKNTEGQSRGTSSDVRTKGLHGMVDLNTNFTSGRGGVGADFILGSRLRRFYHIGGGFGFHSLLSRNIANMLVSIYFNNIFYIPTKGKVYPMFDCAVGCNIGLSKDDKLFGVYAKAGAGIEVGAFNFTIGYEYIENHTGYIKFGYNF